MVSICGVESTHIKNAKTLRNRLQWLAIESIIDCTPDPDNVFVDVKICAI
jgi:hypothetical protein